jgi:hypothetical protein
MALPLTREMLEQAYEYLCVTPPFNKWNLPHGEDIAFRVVRSRDMLGWYSRLRGGQHIIALSTNCIGRTDSLMATMAHEMIHLHQAAVGMETPSHHNTAFKKLAARVCAIHGFDPKLF